MTELEVSNSDKKWAMVFYLSGFTGFVIPYIGFLVPIIIWKAKSISSEFMESHGKNAGNMMLNFYALGLISILVFLGASLYLGFARNLEPIAKGAWPFIIFVVVVGMALYSLSLMIRLIIGAVRVSESKSYEPSLFFRFWK